MMSSALIVNSLPSMPHLDHPPPSPSPSNTPIPTSPPPNDPSHASSSSSSSSTSCTTTPLLCFGDIPISSSFLQYNPSFPPSPSSSSSSPPSVSHNTSSAAILSLSSPPTPHFSSSSPPPLVPAQGDIMPNASTFGPTSSSPIPSRTSSDTISSSSSPVSRRSSDSDSPGDRSSTFETMSSSLNAPSVDMSTTSSAYGLRMCRNDGGGNISSCGPGLSIPTDTFMALQELKASMVELAHAATADDHLSDQEELWPADSWPALDVYSSDDFRMFEFKVRKCVRGRSHDWTECPFSHPGEKARRRDPRRYHYSGTACPDFRKGNCRRGDACEFAHGVFECWLHPARYRTQPCKDGRNCRRRVCFFAHTPEQLRVVPAEAMELAPSPVTPGGSGSVAARTSLLKAAAALSGGAYDGSPLRRALAGTLDGKVALELFLDHDSKSSSTMREPTTTSLRGGVHIHQSSCNNWAAAAANISSPNSTLVPVGNISTPNSPVASSSSPDSPPLICNSPVSHSWPAMVPTHRRHLDRLRSTPTLSVPSFEDTCELMNSLHALGQLSSPGTNTVQSCREARPSLWSRGLTHLQNASLPLSAPSSPFARYGYSSTKVNNNIMNQGLEGSDSVEVKSDIGFKSASFSHGRVGSFMDRISPATVKSASFSHGARTSGTNNNEPNAAFTNESESPDLGWVNELVQ